MAGFDPSNLIKGLEQAKQVKLAAAARAVNQYAQHVVGQAQQLTPVLTGALQASGRAEPAQVSDDAITAKLGFNTAYAVFVHENLEAHHKVGQAKYLTAALQASASGFGPFVADAVKGAE